MYFGHAGIPGPFGHTWGDTTIRGHACRGNGIVNNELYAGVLVWNRQRFIKDPNTGKRVSRPNPEVKWIRTEVLELRIVDDELWQRVKLRQAELAKQFEATTIGVRAARAERLNRLRRPAFLLSGLLICGCCGTRYGIVVNDPERAAVPLGQNSYLWDGAANTWFWVDPSNELVFVGLVQLLIPGQMLDLPVRTRQTTTETLLKITNNF